jgi:subtilisin family serine protease
MDETRVAAVAASEESARQFPGELTRQLLAATRQPTPRETFEGYTRELNAFTRARAARGPAGASPAGPAVKALVPTGPGELLVYPAAVPTGPPGAPRARGEASFEGFLQAVSSSSCRVRVERNFVPEPDGTPPPGESPAARGAPAAARSKPPTDWAAVAVRLDKALELLAARRPGEKAGHGVVLVHLDTGYTRNCQFWDAPHGYTPLNPEKGYDFFDGNDDPTDPMTPGSFQSRQPGHGTGTGTVISSPYDQGALGSCNPNQATDAVRGMAPGVTLVPARISDGVVLGLPPVLNLAFPRLDHRVAALAAGAYQAAHGTGELPKAQVLSMSLGGADCDCPPEERAQRQKLAAALLDAEAEGLIVIAAAGQYPGVAAAARFPAFGGKRPVTFPGSWESTIAVSASDLHDLPWKDAARGPEVDVTAPGVDVWRGETRLGDGGVSSDGVDAGSGTSFSTAVVAGLASIWIQYHGYEPLHGCYQGALASTFRWVLKNGGARRPPGWKTDEFGAGIVDASGLLGARLPSPAEVCAAERPRRTKESWARLCGFTQGSPPAPCTPLVASRSGG